MGAKTKIPYRDAPLGRYEQFTRCVNTINYTVFDYSTSRADFVFSEKFGNYLLLLRCLRDRSEIEELELNSQFPPIYSPSRYFGTVLFGFD